MISFLIAEIRSAVLWTKDVAILFLKWTIRWVLRAGMIGVLLFMCGKGCYYAAAVLDPFAGRSLGNAQQNVMTGATAEPRVEPEAYTVHSQPSAARTTEIRSGWSTFRYIVEDLSRWLRRR